MDLRNDLQKLFQTLPGTVNELGETAANLPGVVDLRLFQLPDRTGAAANSATASTKPRRPAAASSRILSFALMMNERI